MMRAASVTLALLFASLVPLVLSAQSVQFSIPGADSALSISLSPRYPSPGQSVYLTLNSSLYDLGASSIVWSNDSGILAQGDGLTSITVPAGSAGTRTNVHVDVTAPTGVAATDIAIIPTSVDIAWEGTSYTPPFYLGRSLPSAGTAVRLVALAHFTRADGSAVAPADIVYTWKKDGQLLTDISGRGKSSAQIDGPTLFGSENIFVDAATTDGSLAGEGLVHVSDTKPALLLYEDHPLFGVRYGSALSPTTLLPDTEMTFAAAPYFAPAQSASDARLEYAWTVNDASVESASHHADELTINAASSSGLALIRLALTHTSNYFFSADGAWNVTLNSRAGGASFNPFGQ